MAFMNATVEIDKAGRLVVPKPIRDALHLVPGSRLVIHSDADGIHLQPERKPRGLFRKNGRLVFESGQPILLEHADLVAEAREARTDRLDGAWNDEQSSSIAMCSSRLL